MGADFTKARTWVTVSSYLIEWGQMMWIVSSFPLWSMGGSNAGLFRIFEEDVVWQTRIEFSLVAAAVGTYTLLVGVAICFEMGPTDGKLSLLVYKVLPGVGFLTIQTGINRLIASKSIGLSYLVVLYVCSLFYSTAPFIACYQEDNMEKDGDVHHTPRFVVAERFLKTLVAFWATLDTLGEDVRLWGLILLISVFSFALVARKPCNVPSFNCVRHALVTSVLYALLVTGVFHYSTGPSTSNATAIYTLAIGFVLLFCVFLPISWKKIEWKFEFKGRIAKDLSSTNLKQAGSGSIINSEHLRMSSNPTNEERETISVVAVAEPEDDKASNNDS